MGEKNKKPTFTEAVQAIVESHTRLYDLLMEVLPAYRGEAEMPPRERRISRILDCETNDAHRLLENLATAAKAVPRGSLGADPDILIAECGSFLEFLENLFRFYRLDINPHTIIHGFVHAYLCENFF